jgi:hypothetical protein
MIHSGTSGRCARELVLLLAFGSAVGCSPSTIIGPLRHQQEERGYLLRRAREAGVTTNLLEKVFPPLTNDEAILADEQDGSCQSSYIRKNASLWTGSGLVAASAGLTIGGAYSTDSKLAFGVSAGTMAAVGSGLVAIGGIIQQRFSDRGCVTRLHVK